MSVGCDVAVHRHRGHSYYLRITFGSRSGLMLIAGLICVALFLLELLMTRWVNTDGLRRWNSSSLTSSSKPSPETSCFIVNGGKIGIFCA